MSLNLWRDHDTNQLYQFQVNVRENKFQKILAIIQFGVCLLEKTVVP